MRASCLLLVVVVAFGLSSARRTPSLSLAERARFVDPEFGEREEPGRDEGYTYLSVCEQSPGNYTLVSAIDCRKQVAVGRWRNAVNTTGWTFLEIETRAEFAPEVQAYAAGFLEGSLSRTLLQYSFINTVNQYCVNYTKYCQRLNAFVDENSAWIKEQLSSQPQTDLYWQAVNRTYHQLSGMIDAYEQRDFKVGLTFERHPILMGNLNGDFYDLERKLNKTVDSSVENGHCSGFVRVAKNNSDLFFSQVTMSGFQNMLRVLKLYSFAFDQAQYPGRQTSMASYPGILYSSDDFQLNSAGLAILETTINVFNSSIYQKTQAKGQLMTWIRANIASLLGRSALHWCQIFEKYNSGTYNNQWVVVDYKYFTPNKPLVDSNLIYVLEQLPGLVVYRDMTWFLRKHSYFPSYNIPYFKNVSIAAGWPAQGDRLGDWYRWGKSPRAKIFDRDQDNVNDIDGLTKLMRYNNYQKDEFSRCNCTPPYSAEAAISARGDLNPRNGTFQFPGQGHQNHGALDYKGTNYARFKKLRFRAWGGPTWTDVPPFRWSTFDINVSHVGHPDLWQFNYLEVEWDAPVSGL